MATATVTCPHCAGKGWIPDDPTAGPDGSETGCPVCQRAGVMELVVDLDTDGTAVVTMPNTPPRPPVGPPAGPPPPPPPPFGSLEEWQASRIVDENDIPVCTCDHPANRHWMRIDLSDNSTVYPCVHPQCPCWNFTSPPVTAETILNPLGAGVPGPTCDCGHPADAHDRISDRAGTDYPCRHGSCPCESYRVS